MGKLIDKAVFRDFSGSLLILGLSLASLVGVIAITLSYHPERRALDVDVTPTSPAARATANAKAPVAVLPAPTTIPSKVTPPSAEPETESTQALSHEQAAASPPPEVSPEVQKAFAAFDAKDLPKAESILIGVLDKKPDDLVALQEIVSVYIESKQWEKAVPFAERAILLKPQSKDIIGDFVYVTSQSGETVEGLGVLDRLVDRYPDNADLSTARTKIARIDAKG